MLCILMHRKAAMKSISNSMGDAAQNRNRRLFGNLLGHLNQARTILSKDQTLFDRQVCNRESSHP